MNRVLPWLLLVFGLIIAAVLGLYLFHLHGTPRLAASPAATVAPASPVQVTEVERRRPDMLLVAGRAPNGSKVSLTLNNGEEVGSATAGHDGAFQLTTSNLPRTAALPLTLSVPDIAPLQLLVVERTPQVLTLVRGLAGWQPLAHPAKGSAILVVAQDNAGLTVAGQTQAGSTLYIYADNRLIRKLTLGAGSSPALFTAALTTQDAPQNNLRIDVFDSASAQPVAQLFLDKGALQGDARAWQRASLGEATLYVWRDPIPAEPAFKSDFPGQFLPVAPAPVAVNP